jgi:hypothetical protein
MENFMLWGFAGKPKPSLSFFATRIQHQCINKGTREMIDQMLADAGMSGVDYTDWSIEYFQSNYYSSPDEAITSNEAWSDTWEIRVKLSKPLQDDLRLPDDDGAICRTAASDATWEGEYPNSPSPYVIVARFYNKKLFVRAFAALSEFQKPEGYIDPEVQDLIDDLKKDPASKSIKVRKRIADPMILAVEFGTYDEESFPKKGARLAKLLAELIEQFITTITWDQKTAYLSRKKSIGQ